MCVAAPSSPQLPLLSRQQRCDWGLSHLTLYTETQHSSQPATAHTGDTAVGVTVFLYRQLTIMMLNAKCYFVDMLLEECETG